MRRTLVDGGQAVTRDEFDSFTTHVDSRFLSLATSIDRLNDKIDGLSKPSYGILLSAASIMLTLVGFGGALIASSMTSMGELSKARDEAIVEMVHRFESGSNRWSKDDHRHFADDVNRQIDQVLIEIRSRGEWMSRTETRISKIEAMTEQLMRSHSLQSQTNGGDATTKGE